jgi:hypothetical protein
MPTLSELFNLDPNVERLSLLPRLRGSLPSEKSVMMPDRYMPDVIAPKILYDFIRAIKAPGRAKRGEVLDEEEALNTALNMFGGGLATSGSVPIGALGMSARTAPAGTVPLREIPRSPLGFYSKVEEATLPLQNKGSGGQFLAQIQKTPGVKPEEIEVLGLDKFLQSKPTVTKQEVQDYITANKPDVQEVRLDEPQFTTENRLELESLFNIPRRERTAEQSSRVDELLAISDREIDQPVTKFSKYTIPGGENYREILLKLPNQWEKPRALQEANSARIRELKEQMHGTSGSDEIRSEISRLHRENTLLQQQISDAPIYKSSHFDQPNILTHLRANDRVIDGKKALFIEEIQSDWHQAGRKKGYKNTSLLSAQEIADQQSDIFRRFDAGLITREQRNAEIDSLNAAKQNLQAVPDAPFKKSWHELALKRAIQEAVDKGYDKLAFTTGKTQAERYDLSKQVSTLRAPYDNGEYVVSYIPKGANDYEYMGRFLEKDLPGAVGKELAEKIVANKNVQSMTYKGDDLRVGGEGMKGFYDEILPKALQNLTKKYGTKVTKTTMKAGQDVTEPGIVAPGVGMEFAGKTTKAPEVEVWSIDITPQMREQIASKGQPLFATAPPLGLASQDPLEQFVGAEQPKFTEQDFDPLMRYLGYK